MADILHRVGIKSSSPDNTYKALTTREGLSAWWTNDTQGENKVGGVLQFRFDGGGFDMKILELHPAKRVLWQVVEGPDEWIGTKVSWEFKQEGDYNRHCSFRQQVGFLPEQFVWFGSTQLPVLESTLAWIESVGYPGNPGAIQ
jgi:uncharacterized protein YndB with AHSA1/START domain